MPSSPPDPSADVQIWVDRDLGRVRLNRPRAINSLTAPMIEAIGAALAAWRSQEEVTAVVLDGAGERGLCAGADLRAMSDSARTGGHEAIEFFRSEYRVNAAIARFDKPFVALMDGIVMGGGVGLSAHAALRVVTERTRLAMPEVTIGLVPDVGGTFLLSRAPGETGTHLALTGAAISGSDSVWAGLADHLVASDRLEELAQALPGADPVEVVAKFAAEPGPSSLQAAQGWIDDCYAFDTIEQILQALREAGQAGALEAAELITAKSPTAVKVTLESLRRARTLPSLEDVLEQEFRVSCACLNAPDLVEGIRAQVVDKDRSPRWSPASLTAVTAEDVAGYFLDNGAGRVFGRPSGG